MKKINSNRKLTVIFLSAAMAASLAGCRASSQASSATGTGSSTVVESAESGADSAASESVAESTAETEAETSTETAETEQSGSENNTSTATDNDFFTDRDLEQTADTSEAQAITVESSQDITISEEGVYILTGTAENSTIIVDVADDNAKVQLVLDGLNVTNEDYPVIYVKSADKVFVTTTDTENTLTVTGEFVSDGDTNTDSVIFSKDDLVLNGVGTLTINSSDNGISCKDELKVTGGTYVITSEADSIEANDAIYIADGTFNITSSKDAFHCENDDDDTLGAIYILDGDFTINAESDAIQATSSLIIDWGTFEISAEEGLEGTFLQINDGTFDIEASDDGINASQKSSAYTATVEINGGDITIVMGAGDTDGIDSNGDLIINGGTVNITANSPFDYVGAGVINGGTVIVNGQEITTLTNQFEGGMGGGMMPWGDQGNGSGQMPGGDQGQRPGGLPGGNMGGGGRP